MPFHFEARTQRATFESPFKEFETITLEGEIRTDPLTGHVTRIAPFRLKPFQRRDVSELVARSARKCPFCPDRVLEKSSRFTPDFGVPGGRIRDGAAVLFPNAFPYADYSAVAVLGPEHFVEPEAFTPDMFLGAFRVSREYFLRVLDKSPQAVHASINMNYMPLAGAGLIHPHVQVLAAETPTRFHHRLLEAAAMFNPDDPCAVFRERVRQERDIGVRYVGRTGEVHWMTAFAPVGMYDVWGVLPQGPPFHSMTGESWFDFADGICRVLKFLDRKNVQSFNLALYTRNSKEGTPTFHLVRLVPRVNLPEFEVSDINYFERLHDESLTFVPPEEAAGELRDFFP